MNTFIGAFLGSLLVFFLMSSDVENGSIVIGGETYTCEETK